MRVAIVNQPGIKNLSIVDRPDPEAGPGEVLVRMRAATLNYRDLLTVEGGYGSKQRTTDFIPLSYVDGEVISICKGVKRFKTGDRVVGNFFQEWFNSLAIGLNLLDIIKLKITNSTFKTCS